MRGRLSIANLAEVRGLIHQRAEDEVRPSLPHPAARIVKFPSIPGVMEGQRGTPQPIPQSIADRIWRPGKFSIRRWNLGLGDAAAVATPALGFWATLGQGVTNAVSGVLPALAQVQAARLLTSSQASLLRQEGTQLYTPSNLETLRQRAEFEAAQRQIDQGRALGTTGLPMSGTTMAVLGLLAAGGLYLAMRK